MKVFLIQSLSITFVLLITGSIQSVTADHLEPGQGIFKNEREIEAVPIQDSNYQIYLQTVLRNVDGHMISVAEGMHGFVIPHQVTDHVFDTLMGKKEIVTIDNIKYEKAQYVDPPMKEDEVDYVSIWALMICGEIYGHGHECVSVFQASTAVGLITQTDVVTNQWTILRELN